MNAGASTSAVAGREMDEPALVRVAGLEQMTWLRHGFSSRQGGCSTVYGGRSLNLGWTAEDDPECVVANRRVFTAALTGQDSTPMVGLRQVHSSRIRIVTVDADGVPREEDSGLAMHSPEGRPALEGDALMTDSPGVLLAAGAADCVPVLVADPVRRAVAAFHAGWRGTAARIVEQGIAAMVRRYGARAEDLVAAIGPSIGPCCYTVGEELRAEFGSRFAYAAALFSDHLPPANSAAALPHLDLWEANRRQLLNAGLPPQHISLVAECTACTRAPGGLKYFSHRAEHGHAGRGLGAIGRIA